MDFSPFKTYAWLHAVQPKTGDARLDNDLTDARIRAALNQTLPDKGLVFDEDNPDVLVAYFVDVTRRIGGNTMAFGMGYGQRGRRYSAIGYDTAIYDYEEGALTIDIIDAQTQKTIWRGSGYRNTYSGSNPEKATEIINSSVARILKKFPPK